MLTALRHNAMESRTDKPRPMRPTVMKYIILRSKLLGKRSLAILLTVGQKAKNEVDFTTKFQGAKFIFSLTAVHC